MVNFSKFLIQLTTTTHNYIMEINNNLEKLQEQAINLVDTIEDVAEYFCDEHFISGEQFYVMMKALIDTKLQQFPFDYETFEEDIYDGK